MIPRPAIGIVAGAHAMTTVAPHPESCRDMEVRGTSQRVLLSKRGAQAVPYIFGDFLLDPQQYELRRQGARIPCRPKVFQVLTTLIEHRHRVVTRDELLEHV